MWGKCEFIKQRTVVSRFFFHLKRHFEKMAQPLQLIKMLEHLSEGIHKESRANIITFECGGFHVGYDIR